MPVEVLAPFSRAAKFLAGNCFCFGLLHYSAKCSLSLCSPRGTIALLVDSCDIVLVRLLLPLTTVRRLKSPSAHPSPETRPPFALLRLQVENESDKCLIRDSGLLVWASAAVGAIVLRLTPWLSPRCLFSSFLPLVLVAMTARLPAGTAGPRPRGRFTDLTLISSGASCSVTAVP